MAPALLPKTALAALAAIALFLPFGAPLPGSCLRAIGVAGAAPSPSCGGDLRECLRAAADLHTTTFGGRYVTADDVARCMDAFRSCTSGGASRGENQSAPDSGSTTSTKADSRTALPDRLGIPYYGDADMDCQLNGNSVKCAVKHQLGTMTESEEITGSLSGLTMTGTHTKRVDEPGSDGCGFVTDITGPATVDFSPDGTVKIRIGESQMAVNYTSDCGNSYTTTIPEAAEVSFPWSPIN